MSFLQPTPSKIILAIVTGWALALVFSLPNPWEICMPLPVLHDDPRLREPITFRATLLTLEQLIRSSGYVCELVTPSQQLALTIFSYVRLLGCVVLSYLVTCGVVYARKSRIRRVAK